MDAQGVFVLYDRVAEDFGPVFEAKTDGVAVRKVRQLAEKQGLRNEDYILYCIGEVQRKAGEARLVAYGQREIVWKEEIE